MTTKKGLLVQRLLREYKFDTQPTKYVRQAVTETARQIITDLEIRKLLEPTAVRRLKYLWLRE